MYRKAYASKAENELANVFWELNYAVVRGPSSGSGVRKRYQPDLIAMKNGVIFVMEIKTKRKEGGNLYISSSQVLGLEEFSKRAGGIAIIAFKRKGREWRFHLLESLIPVGKNFKIKEPEKGLRIRDLEEMFFRRNKDIRKYIR